MRLTYESMLERHGAIRERANKITKTRQARAQRLAREAGVSDLGHGHNAMVGLHYGKPWRGIDYQKLRLALHINESSFAPQRVADAAWTRLYDQWRAGGFAYASRKGS